MKRQARKGRAGSEAGATLEAQSLHVSALKVELEKLEAILPPGPIPVLGSASATPAVSTDAVYVIFGNGVVAKVDFSGAVVWARNLGKPIQDMNGYFRGQAASPRIVGNVLIAPLNHLYALSTADGTTIWKGDIYRDYGTPAVVSIGSQSVVVTPSGLVVNAVDGLVIVRDVGKVYYSSPVVAGQTVFFVGSREDQEMVRHVAAVKILKAEIGASVKSLWSRTTGVSKTYSSPLLAEGSLYSIDEKSQLIVLDPQNGNVRSEIDLRDILVASERNYPSPAFAGGYLFVSNEAGTTAVFKAGQNLEKVAVNKLEPMRSSLVFIGDRIYARTLEYLFCLKVAKR